MFDDVKKNDQNKDDQNNSQLTNNSQPVANNDFGMAQSTPKETSGAGTIDDMFNDLDPVATKPSAISEGKIEPKVVSSNFATQSNQNTNLNQMLMEEETKSSSWKKMIVALVGLILVALVAWGAYAVFFGQKNTPVTDTQNNSQNVIDNNQNNSVNQNTDNNQNTDANDDDSDGLPNAQEDILKTNPLSPDTDEDGLSDKDEVRVYLTDPLNPDTDNDGLFDREEVIFWQTDPLKSDTDGDGFLDGVEVTNGYNPLGEGQIDNQVEIITQ